MKNVEKIIDIQNLTKYYGKHRGVEKLSLSVKEGEIYGFIGPNGAGKSTTIRTMLGLLRPDGGKVEILGERAETERERKALLSRIGYMPSEAFFYSGMKVADVLKFSAGFYREDCREERGRLCERLKLDMKKKVDELSLGNRKKVSIVCALQHNALLYVLDEPTSGLDPLMQREFFRILKEKNEEGATVFLSSHVLGEVEKYCRRAALIRDGRVVMEDTVEHLCGSAAKRVTLRGMKELSVIRELDGIGKMRGEGEPEAGQVTDIQEMEDGLSFLYRGAPGPLLRALSQLSLTDVTITDPDLEETFLHFYSRGKTEEAAADKREGQR